MPAAPALPDGCLQLICRFEDPFEHVNGEGAWSIVLATIRHPRFRSLQGLACTMTRIADAPLTTSLGIDGIVWHDDSVIAVQNGFQPSRVARFVLNSRYTRIVRVDDLDRQPSLADEPTIGTLWRGGFVYAANSQWEKYDDDGRRIPGTSLRPTLLLRVPLAVRK